MIVSSFLETDLSATLTPSSTQSFQDGPSPSGGSSTDETFKQSTLDIQNWISALDRDTLLTMVKASLQKTGGAQESSVPQPGWEGSIQGQGQYPLSGYSRSTPGSDPLYQISPAPYFQDYRDLPGPSNQEKIGPSNQEKR